MRARDPIRGPGYLVLASLLDGPLRGYAIIQRISEFSEGGTRMATGTMYAALDRLTATGHVELVRKEIVNGRVRRSYGLTPAGVAALRAGAEQGAAATRPLVGRDRRTADGHPSPEGEPRGVTALERRCRLLLRAYPAWYRRERAEEMLGTLLEASPAGRNWPSVRDARALAIGGLRVRGWTWLLSMLWVAAGAVITGYIFYSTTPNYISADIAGTGLIGFNAGPAAVQIAAVLALAVWVALPVPMLIAGFIRLRGWRPANWPRAAAWAGAWIAGAVLLKVAQALGNPPGVSWGELAVCAAWLALGVMMTRLLSMPARYSGIFSTFSYISSKSF